jgi:hypothetical protein
LAELALDHAERMLHLGPDAGLQVFDLVEDLADLAPLLEASRKVDLPGVLQTFLVTELLYVSKVCQTPPQTA